MYDCGCTTHRSEKVGLILPLITKARMDFLEIKLSKKGHNYMYAPLTEVVAAFEYILPKHGLGVIQQVVVANGKHYVQTIVSNESEQWVSLCIGADDNGGRNLHGMQALGGAITYARRYGFMCIFCLIAEEDDDAALISKPQPKKESPSPLAGLVWKKLQELPQHERESLLSKIKSKYGTSMLGDLHESVVREIGVHVDKLLAQ